MKRFFLALAFALAAVTARAETPEASSGTSWLSSPHTFAACAGADFALTAFAIGHYHFVELNPAMAFVMKFGASVLGSPFLGLALAQGGMAWVMYEYEEDIGPDMMALVNVIKCGPVVWNGVQLNKVMH